MLNSAGTNFLLTDALGSVVSSLSNTANSAVVNGNQTYGPYGNQAYSKGTVGTNKGYTGQYNDALTQLDYYGARYYDPFVGNFLSADTVQGNLQGIDTYNYVGGNPETRTDPTGHYYSNGRSITEQGGAIAYVTANMITIVSNQEFGSIIGLNGLSTKPNGNLHFDTYTWHQAAQNGGYSPYTDARHSPVAKISDVIGLTQLQQTWSDPNASWQDKAGAVGQFIGTNLNNAFQLAMIVGGGPEGEGSDLLNGLAECGGLSFTPTTLVATAHGEQAIGTMKVGEKVWAYNPKTKKMELEPVLHVWINHDNDLVDLTLTPTTSAKQSKTATTTSETIHTNKKHPFLTKEKGFLSVGQMTLGMHVLRADGTYGVVTGWKVVLGVKVMYNLEVAQDHTFTVGSGEWVVHNCGGTLPAQAQARAEEIGNAIDSQIGSWNRNALTIGSAIVDDGGEMRTLIATNEGASNSLVKLVKAQLQDGETFVSLGDNQGRHAEEVLIQYAKDNGLLQQIKGFGASNNFCNTRCGPMLIQELGQDLLGQPWPRP